MYKMAGYYYNQEEAWGKEVIITRKQNDLPEGVGVLDIELAKIEKPASFLPRRSSFTPKSGPRVTAWCLQIGR